MVDIPALLELAKSTAARAGERLEKGGHLEDFSFSEEFPREVKSLADAVLEDVILGALSGTGLEILSEERGLVPGARPGGHRFIVDPLDGTFNHLRNLGPCAVSIALWEADRPVFGVIFDIVKKSLCWGGKPLGAWRDGREIRVSRIGDVSRAAICTGFPVRFDFSAEKAWGSFRDRVSPFAKVRMLGSAASSLACVADGRAEAYFEENIMLWDVAAGIAIVEGAGGRVCWREKEGSLDVLADNGCLETNL
ncbi:MAG: inositol monophosphatase family protein [Terrimicrobiaceae bacterium]